MLVAKFYGKTMFEVETPALMAARLASVKVKYDEVLTVARFAHEQQKRVGVCVPRMCGVTVQWAETKPQRKGQRQ